MSPRRFLIRALAGGLLGVSLLAHAAQPGDVRVYQATPHSVRLVIGPIQDTPVLASRAWPEAQELGSDNLALGGWRLNHDAATGTIRICRADDSLVQEIRPDASGQGFSFALGAGPLLGLGGGGRQFDRRGAVLPLLNGQWTPDKSTHGARIAVPYLIGTEGWAIFVLSSPGSFDLAGARGEFRTPVGTPPGLDLLVFDARDPLALMRELAELTGPAVLPPKWAFGYLQSHRTLTSAAEVLAVADIFRAKELPCDGVIYLGTGFCPSGWNRGHDSLEFNPAIFGDKPAALLEKLHARNFHIVAHVTPPPVELRYASGPAGAPELVRKRWDGDELHGAVTDVAVDVADSRHVENYWRRHESAFAAGMDGWWPDEGDAYDVASRFARHRMYYEGPLASRPGVRPWNFQRNGYTGVARYGGWIWSGDLESRWASLAAQVPVALNFSLTVSPFWGSDIGGWKPTRELTGELFVRWFQFAAFTPSFRGHGRMWQLRLPWGWGVESMWQREPAAAPDDEAPAPGALPDARVEPICRRYLELRYQLLPYNYSLARQARDDGLPLMRALWLHYPQDACAIACGDEYLWGRDLLVAPVTSPGAATRKVYLPPGQWHDWWTGARHAGGRDITRAVDLATLPLYARAGAIIPLDAVRQHTGEVLSTPTTLRIFPGADGAFTLYADDGATTAYLAGHGTWTRFTWHDAARRLRIERLKSDAPLAPREFLVQVGLGTPRVVSFDGQAAEIVF